MKKLLKKINPEIVMLILISFIPVIVHLKIVPLEGQFYSRYVGNMDGDFYSYYKAFIFIVITAILFLLFFIKLIKKDIKLKSSGSYKYIIIYFIFVLLSTLLSVDKNISFFGFCSRYEGLFVLISYLLIFIITYNVIDNEAGAKKVIFAVSISSFIIGLIGLTQFIGHDVLQSKLGKSLLVFGVNGVKASDINFTLEKHTVYGTLVNSNYMGSFVLLVLPLFLILAIKSKNIKHRVMYIILSLIMVICLFGSRSRAGIFGAIVVLILSLVIFRDMIIKRWKYALSIAMVGMIAVFIMNAISGGTILKKYTSIYLDPRQSINSCSLEDVDIKKDTVTIKSKDETFIIKISSNIIEFYDEKGSVIPHRVSNGKVVFDNEKYKNYILEIAQIDSVPVIKTSIKDIELYFGVTGDGIKFLNPRKELVDLKPVAKWGFEGKEQLGSSRGYIWSRSLPLLKDTVFIGNGPDTFAVNFPQDDYIGKIKAYGTTNMLVDKPHNMYLQTAINTGVISLLALLALFIIYVAQSFKLYFNVKFDDYYSIIGVGIFLGVTGYLFAGLFNDSVVSVAPIFWMLLGIGMSVNGVIGKNNSIEFKSK